MPGCRSIRVAFPKPTGRWIGRRGPCGTPRAQDSVLPLRGFDEDLRTRAAAALQAAGVELHPGAVPREVQRAGGQWLLIAADERMREYPFVLNATGRRPNTVGLGLENLGIELDADGAVPVDAQLHSKAEAVYAIGDVTNKWNLTPVAIAEGRALADSLFGPLPREVDLSLVASAVFTLPPLATLGPTEAEAEVAVGARSRRRAVVAGVAPLEFPQAARRRRVSWRR